MININDNHKKFDFAIKILEDEFKSRELIFKVKTRRSNFDISKLVKLIEIQNAIELLKRNNK